MKPHPINPSHYKTQPGASVTELQDTLRRAAEAAFGGDRAKIALFLHSANPRLQMMSPAEICTCSGGLAACLAALSPKKAARRKAGGGML
jgi:Protein of unknown function (DUF2384)